MENTNEKSIRYLKDLHAAETGVADIFEGLAKDDDLESNLRQQASGWHQQTNAHASQIQQRLQSLGGDNSSAKDFINNLIAKASDLTNIGHDKEDKLTQDLIKAYSGVAILVGSYESLRAFASVSGDNDLSQFAANGRSEDEALAKEILSAIGRKAPTAAGNATDTVGTPSTTSAVY